MNTLFNNRSGQQTFVDATAIVLGLMGKEMYSIRNGKGASTDAKGTIWLPPLPETATDDDKVKYFCNAVHEEGHNEHGSDTDLMSKIKMIHHYENCIDDIRIERLQEVMYKGLIKYRKRGYAILADEFLRERFASATVEDLPAFIDTIGVYTIAKIRSEQMGLDIDWNPSADLTEAYNKYIRDLEKKINTHSAFNDSLSIAHTIIERLKDLIREAEEQKKNKKNKKDSGSNPGEGPEGDSNDSNNSGKPDQTPGNGDSTEDSPDPKTPKGTSGNGEEIDIDKLIEEISGKMEGTDLQGIVREQIDKNAQGLYYVGPGVQDIIRENNKGSLSYANQLKAAGIRILGPAGAQMTRYMISQSRMRSLHNTRSGKMDMISLNADVHDNRQNIYSREIPGAIEKAAVSICMDNSDSMREISPIAYSVLSGILYYLDKANVPSEATGFTADPCTNDNFRDTPVTLSIIKKFDESFKGAALQRCVPPSRMRLTSEVDCLKYAVPRLMQRKESKKILFVIGDGSPYLKGKTITIKNAIAYNEYIQLCRKAGIIVVGFGINCDLSHFFGDDCINITPDTMGTEIAKKLTEILNRKR